MVNEQMVRNSGDLIGLATWGAWFVGWIPTIGLTFTAIWTFFRLVEMITGKPFHQTRMAAAIRYFFRWIVRPIWPKRGDSDDA
jgi:hypothetical protein